MSFCQNIEMHLLYAPTHQDHPKLFEGRIVLGWKATGGVIERVSILGHLEPMNFQIPVIQQL